MTGDGGDTCFLKLSLTRAGRKNFPESLPPAYVREISGKACHRCHPVTRKYVTPASEVSLSGILSKSLTGRK